MREYRSPQLHQRIARSVSSCIPQLARRHLTRGGTSARPFIGHWIGLKGSKAVMALAMARHCVTSTVMNRSTLCAPPTAIPMLNHAPPAARPAASPPCRRDSRTLGVAYPIQFLGSQRRQLAIAADRVENHGLVQVGHRALHVAAEIVAIRNVYRAWQMSRHKLVLRQYVDQAGRSS